MELAQRRTRNQPVAFKPTSLKKMAEVFINMKAGEDLATETEERFKESINCYVEFKVFTQNCQHVYIEKLPNSLLPKRVLKFSFKLKFNELLAVLPDIRLFLVEPKELELQLKKFVEKSSIQPFALQYCAPVIFIKDEKWKTLHCVQLSTISKTYIYTSWVFGTEVFVLRLVQCLKNSSQTSILNVEC